MVNGGDRIVLADHGPESPSGLSISTAGAVQVVEFVRAENAQAIDRGNRRTVVGFQVAREHRSALEAQQFLADHILKMVWDGHLILEALGGVGQRSERYLTEAVVETAEGSHIGASTFHRYQIVGSTLRTKKP